jgi:adhesin transport system outer membrane protein
MKIGRITYSLSALAFIMSSSLNATTIKDVVEHTLVSNQDIVSKSINNDAFKKYIDEQEGGYYPKIDLTANVGVVDQNETVRGNSRTDTNHNGGNVQLDLEQLLYDGNLTPSLVEEAKARYSANKLKNSDDVENILFDGINAYLNILKYDERIKASKENLLVHEDYLSIATQTERINGEILDKVQTKAKIHSAKSNLFEETNNKSAATSSFVKNVGMPIDNNICKPVLNEGKIPATLEALQKSALENNYKILEQIESIKQQRAAIEKEKAGFLPTLKFKLQSLYDNDFADNEVKTNTYTAKVELKYNIFNGMVNSNRTEREVLFLKEVQAKLDVVTKSVLDEVTVAYETYNTAKKQIVELQQFIEENKQIISIYKDQFDAGTRNFIDVLNVEGDLYNSKLALINTEFTMYTAYYNILKATSSLQTTVVSSENQACEQVTTNKKANAADTSVQSLLAEDTATTTVETAKPAALTSGEYALLLESYTTNASAKMAVDTLGALPADVKSKIVANKNGSYTVALYNIDGLQNALELKNQFAAKFPKSYYIKKK